MNADQAPPEGQRLHPSDADVVVIGEGEAGVTVAWLLQRHGPRPLVLEAGDQVSHTWRSRWTSLTLVTPAEYDRLPGRPFPAPADSCPGKDAVADYLFTGVLRPLGGRYQRKRWVEDGNVSHHVGGCIGRHRHGTVPGRTAH